MRQTKRCLTKKTLCGLSSAIALCWLGFNTAAAAQIEGELKNGVLTDFYISKSEKFYYFVTLPAGAFDLRIKLHSSHGDADLYVRQAGMPSLNQWDCRPYESTRDEVCDFEAPAPGAYHVMVNGYSVLSVSDLVATYVRRGSEVEPNDTLVSAQPLTPVFVEVSGSFDREVNRNDYFRLVAPPLATFTVLLDQLPADYDLYLYRASDGVLITSSTNISTLSDQVWWANTKNTPVEVVARVFRYGDSAVSPYRLSWGN
ncbi:MAG: PPC domain-containing protein [Thermoanaerobaculia bacterium]